MPPRRLHPVPIVGEQGRQVLSKSIGQKQRRTVGRQYLGDVVDEALCHGLGTLADVDRHQQFGHRIDGHPDPVRRAGQAFDRLGLTDLTLLDGAEHRIQFIKL